jgi:hypothetical protein
MKSKKGMPGPAPFKMQGKSPMMKQIQSEQKGLQKLASTEKGKKAVKAMGYTEDVDGAMLMNKDYAAMMGGYGKSPVKMDKKKSGSEQRAGKITDADKKSYADYKAKGGKLSMAQAKRIGFKSAKESGKVTAAAKAEKKAKARVDMAKAKRKGLGTKFFADTQKDIYK